MPKLQIKAVHDDEDEIETTGVPGEAMQANETGRVLWADLHTTGSYELEIDAGPKRIRKDCGNWLLALGEQGRKWVGTQRSCR